MACTVSRFPKATIFLDLTLTVTVDLKSISTDTGQSSPETGSVYKNM